MKNIKLLSLMALLAVSTNFLNSAQTGLTSKATVAAAQEEPKVTQQAPEVTTQEEVEETSLEAIPPVASPVDQLAAQTPATQEEPKATTEFTDEDARAFLASLGIDLDEEDLETSDVDVDEDLDIDQDSETEEEEAVLSSCSIGGKCGARAMNIKRERLAVDQDEADNDVDQDTDLEDEVEVEEVSIYGQPVEEDFVEEEIDHNPEK